MHQFGQSPSPSVPTIGAASLEAALADGVPLTLVDVRRDDETDPAPLPGSVRVPHLELLAREDPLPGVDRATPVVVYCRAGVRSALVVERLVAEGFTTALSLEGGLPPASEHWRAAGRD